MSAARMQHGYPMLKDYLELDSKVPDRYHPLSMTGNGAWIKLWTTKKIYKAKITEDSVPLVRHTLAISFHGQIINICMRGNGDNYGLNSFRNSRVRGKLFAFITYKCRKGRNVLPVFLLRTYSQSLERKRDRTELFHGHQSSYLQVQALRGKKYGTK